MAEDPPVDRHHIVYLVLLLHGIGVLMPWNMFINAKSYFVDFKLSEKYTGKHLPYDTYFLSYLTLASQFPNLLFCWLNVFVHLGGGLTTRIVWSIFIEVILFIITIIMAIADTSKSPGAFFWITMIVVVIMNVTSGIYQNSVYGMAASLPGKYTGAIILGSNICGTFTTVINIISIASSPNNRTAAIYYFLTALFVLLACFDAYLALPINRFYRYHDYMGSQKGNENSERAPYMTVVWAARKQLLNVFLTFFVTLSIFPVLQSDIISTSNKPMISPKYFVEIMCFLTFNFTAMLGSYITNFTHWPGPDKLWIVVSLRILFIPFFVFCNYQPLGIERTLPVLIKVDIIYWFGAVAMGLTSGYCSSIAMQSVPATVEPKYASTAGMFGGAVLLTGITIGLFFGLIFPILVSL